MAEHGVDLVEGQPVFHQSLVAGEHGLAELDKQVDYLPPVPAVIVVSQIQGHLVVMKGHQGLDAPLLHGPEQVLVELKPLLVGLLLQAGGIDSGPLDGNSQGLKTHFLKKVQISLIAVIEVDAVAFAV